MAEQRISTGPQRISLITSIAVDKQLGTLSLLLVVSLWNYIQQEGGSARNSTQVKREKKTIIA
jgi:hypothetical protein